MNFYYGWMSVKRALVILCLVSLLCWGAPLVLSWAWLFLIYWVIYRSTLNEAERFKERKEASDAKSA